MNAIRLRLLSLFLLLTCAALRAADEFRTWASADGRAVEAVFVSFENGQVKIKLKNGSVSSVPLERFSAADQAFVKQKFAPADKAEPEATGAPAADKTWPRTLSLDEPAQPQVVKEDAEAKEFLYRTKHYEFQCDSKIGANAVKEFARIFEATYLANCKLPLDLKPQPEPGREYFLARLFMKKEDYFAAGAIPESSGTYMSAMKSLIVPLESLGVKLAGTRVILEGGSNDRDNRTLIHEITHQMMNHWLGKLPQWYIEGSAEYVAMAKYERGKFNFTRMDDRLRDYLRGRGATGKAFTMLKPSELMNISFEQWEADMGGRAAQQNYGSSAVLAYYFYHLDDKGDGANLTAWLREIEGTDDEVAVRAAAEKHLIRGRGADDLEKNVRAAFRKQGFDIDFASRGIGPASTKK